MQNHGGGGGGVSMPAPLEQGGCKAAGPAVTWLCFPGSVRQHERHGQLTLVNSTAADTGEFSCWGQLCNGYVCRRDEAKTGSTYVFFTGNMVRRRNSANFWTGPR